MALFCQTRIPKVFSPRILVCNSKPVCSVSREEFEEEMDRTKRSEYGYFHSNSDLVETYGLSAAHGICANFYFSGTAMKTSCLQNPCLCLSCTYCLKLQELSKQSKLALRLQDAKWKDEPLNFSTRGTYDHLCLRHDMMRKTFSDKDLGAAKRELTLWERGQFSPVVDKQREDHHLNSISPETITIRSPKKFSSARQRSRPKNYRCPYCDVCCSNQGQLKGHVRIHTGERPYKCTEKGCTRAFIRNEELTRHRRIHTGERPHKCGVCGKAFSRKDHLNKHLKVHTYETEYMHV